MGRPEPRWQLARVRQHAFALEPGIYRSGELLWVTCAVPQRIVGTHEVSGTAFYGDAYRRPNGKFIDKQWVELLPEFSFSDDPDTEVRQ